MLKVTQRLRVFVGMVLSVVMLLTCAAAVLTANPEQAEAATWGDYQQKQQETNNLRSQLVGVNSDLANKIIQLNDLTDNQIPAAQQAADDAQGNATQAQTAAQSATDRLNAAIKDKDDLEAKIKQTGIDYDDAKAGVAQVARDSFHATQATQVMDVVTKSSTTQDFVDKMQSQAAVKRSEANAADEDANTLNSSMNRKQRLDAIEEQISKLKVQADSDAATAQQAAQTAQAKQSSLQSLLSQGMSQRDYLQSQSSQLTTDSARAAAQMVSLKAQIDAQSQPALNSYNNNYNAHSSGQTWNNGSSGGSSRPSGGNNYRPAPSTPAPSRPSSGGGWSGGSAPYPPRQCTLWAWIRRNQFGKPVTGSMGNGGQWAATARSMGWPVDNSPRVGDAMVFTPGSIITGSMGYRPVSAAYGHVAIVERVNGDGSVFISEGGTGFATFPAYETVYGASKYQFIH
ncbi:CHAP domain-containing protein [Bifidobacterium sp. ESL0728]|uniref:CHAP domain-containing protein n=1 Tax=Bifidobacterium sp. ESL0728 TaxID=2983220 RepID=UPI0023F75184|nr:CHAP domain-containing protein [Bifidobacterium sp. ESL0728]WEV59585.1 CHAP domain-containing protein [Bifidobacterium sp. ESL0728]